MEKPTIAQQERLNALQKQQKIIGKPLVRLMLNRYRIDRETMETELRAMEALVNQKANISRAA